MKKIILFIMLLILSASSFSQQTALTKQDYLKKSKDQKTAAWVLVAGGAALIVTGGIVWTNEVNKEADQYTAASGNWLDGATYDVVPDGAVITIAGVLSMIGSIPLFIAAGKNKRKAMSLSFKNEMVPSQLLSGQKSSFTNRLVPSLSLKISL